LIALACARQAALRKAMKAEPHREAEQPDHGFSCEMSEHSTMIQRHLKL
jgi:hypothetical protein